MTPTKPGLPPKSLQPKVRTAAEWRDLFQPTDVPGVGWHQRDREWCERCGGFWPCRVARGEE